MTKISLVICMGSACHQKGVYRLLPLLRELLAEYNLEAQIEPKGAFCLGPCMQAIALKVNDQLILNVTPENVRQRFVTDILPLLAEVDH